MPEPFRFSSGHLAYNVQDLIGVCHQSPQEVIYYLKRGDFEKWLAYIGETAIAKKVEEVSKLSVTDEELLKQFINVLEPPETQKNPPTSPPEKTVSDSPATTTPSNQDTSTTEVNNIDSNDKTTESEETSPMTELEDKTLETSSDTPETSEVKEPKMEVTETEAQTSTKTSETSEVKESTTEKTETSATAEVEEMTDKEPETEAKTAVEPEVTEEPPKPTAPINEYSDEGVEAKSSCAKALQGFMSQYISNE